MGILETYLGTSSHPYADRMPLMSSIWYPTVASLLYLIFCNVPRLCRTVDLMPFHRLYNGVRIYSQFILGCFLIYYGIRGGHTLFCTPVPDGVSKNESPYSIKIAWALWGFHVVKLSDLLDCYFILQTYQTVGYLIIYHHISLVYLSWFAVKTIPGGSTIFPVIVNSFAQFVFYQFVQYNKKQRVKARVSFTRALNVTQAIQYIILALHSTVQIFKTDCDYPVFPAIGLIFYTLSLGILTVLFRQIPICCAKGGR